MPGDLGDIAQLQFLDLCTNQLHGMAPAEPVSAFAQVINPESGACWSACSDWMNTNQITGQIPSNFACWPTLSIFDVNTS